MTNGESLQPRLAVFSVAWNCATWLSHSRVPAGRRWPEQLRRMALAGKLISWAAHRPHMGRTWAAHGGKRVEGKRKPPASRASWKTGRKKSRSPAFARRFWGQFPACSSAAPEPQRPWRVWAPCNAPGPPGEIPGTPAGFGRCRPPPCLNRPLVRPLPHGS